jgi:hypothetical protein
MMVTQAAANRQAEPDSAQRTITLAEVTKWFENCHKPRPSDAICNEVAERLTKMRWPNDIGPPYVPPPPKPPNWPKRRKWPPPVRNDDAWWDFQGATDAAKMLLNSIPAMLAHLDGLRWAPETRDHYAAIEALRDALMRSMPYIEWPFGKYERQDYRKRPRENYRKRPRPKWHLHAVLIAAIIVKALIQSGRRKTSTARDSTVVKVVRKTLSRMGYPEIEPGTIAAHLNRWDDNQALHAKQARLALAKFGTTI